MTDIPPFETRQYRRTMSLFATGVAALAVEAADGAVTAMTANSITSVSLDPMLVLVCVEKIANMAEPMLSTEIFSLCFLSESQLALSDYFAGLWKPDDPPEFRFEKWEGGPLLHGCIAAIGCRKYQVYEGGDHWIILGEVKAIHRSETPEEPLIFYRSAYRQVAPLME